MRPSRKDSLLNRLERDILKVLKDTGLTTAERLKAIESGAKIAMIRHRVDDGDSTAGSFFAPERRSNSTAKRNN